MPLSRKREARTLFVDAVGGGGGAALAIVFRGGWIDCIASVMEPGGAGATSAWLESQGFMLEVTGIVIGAGFAAAWGEAEAAKLSGWARAKGLPRGALGSRNAAQARVISSGLEDYLEGAREKRAAGIGSRADR